MADHYSLRTEKLYPEGDASIELGDDERVINSVVRGQQVKVFILTPVTFKCGAMTDDGSRCGITVSEPDQRCHHHQKE